MGKRTKKTYQDQSEGNETKIVVRRRYHQKRDKRNSENLGEKKAAIRMNNEG